MRIPARPVLHEVRRLLSFSLWLARAVTAPVCEAKPRGSVSATIVTQGAVTTRAGKNVSFSVDAGLIRVGGDDAIDTKLARTPAEVPEQAATAVMSYEAYFANGTPPSRRPLIFVWDGGPGSSTASMLLGSFGPVLRASPDSKDKTASTAKPIRPNPDTLLDVADIVFVDAPGTGFGRLEGCSPERSFYGVDEDAAAFHRFILSFQAAYKREASPLFLFGESYGTLRAAVVAHRLEVKGVRVSGVVLSSQMLALDAWSDGSRANPGTENAFFLSLPSFAATAWVHNRVRHDGDLEAWLRGIERFSLEEYAPALTLGVDLSSARKQALAKQLSAYTGLSPQTWLDAGLRIEGTRFRTLLEADEGKIVGREDTRVDGPLPDAQGTAVETDPALTTNQAVRKAAFATYVRGTLGLGDRQFTPFIDGPDIHWNMAHNTDPNGFPDTYVNAGPDLATALRLNNRLRVLLVGGYFDLATPYLGGPYLTKHLDLSDEARARLTWQEYPAGHDPYEVDMVRHDIHDRIAELIQASEN